MRKVDYGKRLFTLDGERMRLRSREDRVGRALLARLRTTAACEPADGEGIRAGFLAAGAAIQGWLHEDPGRAKHSATLVEGVLLDRWAHVSEDAPAGVPLWSSHYKMIMRTDPAVGVAIALSYAGDHWPVPFRDRVAGKLLAKAVELMAGGGAGWNGNPASNWRANTCSGAALCAMGVLGSDAGSSLRKKALPILERARAGVDEFLSMVGDRAWHQESWPYYRYMLGHHLLPYVIACRLHCHPRAYTTGPMPWAPLLFPFVRVGKEAVLPHRQQPLRANHFHSGELLMGAGVLSPEKRPALAWELLDRRLNGGDDGWDVFHPHHALLGLAHLPSTRTDPALLPGRTWVDDRKGFYLWRHRFGCGGALAVDANRHVSEGTGRPECAGAFTLAALGHVWALGAMGKRPRREDYNVPCSPNQNRHAGARTLSYSGTVDGDGSLEIDLSPVLPDAAPARRLFRIHWSSPGGATFDLHDIFTTPVEWRWHGRGAAQPVPGGWNVRMEDGAEMRVELDPRNAPRLRFTKKEGTYTVTATAKELKLRARIGRASVDSPFFGGDVSGKTPGGAGKQ